MPRPRNTDMDDFKAYLRENTRCQDASIHVYASNVRRILRLVRPLTSEGLTAFAYNDCPASSRGNVRKSWTHYCAFRRLSGEELPNMLTMDKMQRESVTGPDTFEPRGDLAQALLRLNQRYRIPATALSAARWKDITPASAVPASLPLTEGPYALMHIPSLQQSFIFPTNLLAPFARWADPRRSQPLMNQPFVCAVEDGATAVPTIQLQHFLLRAARAIQIESTEGPRFDLQAFLQPPADPPVAPPVISPDEKRERLRQAARRAEEDGLDEELEVMDTASIARQLL